MSEKYVSDWYIVPSRIRHLPGITLAYLDVYETVFQFLNKGKDCFMSNRTISERTGHKVRCIQTALRFFEKHGELTRVKSGLKYYFAVPQRRVAEVEPTIDETIEASMTEGGCTAVHGGDAQPCMGGMHERAPINKEDINNKINKNISRVKKNEISKDSESDNTMASEMFEKAWSAYPLKKAKQNAYKAFLKIFEGKTGKERLDLMAVVMQGLAAHIREHRAKKQVAEQGGDIWVAQLPHLSTWFNQRRWEDDYETPDEVLSKAKPKGGLLDPRSIFK